MENYQTWLVLLNFGVIVIELITLLIILAATYLFKMTVVRSERILRLVEEYLEVIKRHSTTTHEAARETVRTVKEVKSDIETMKKTVDGVDYSSTSEVGNRKPPQGGSGTAPPQDDSASPF